MNVRLQIGLVFLAFTMGASADPMLTSGSPNHDPYDKIIVSDDGVTLAGDAAGMISDVVVNPGTVTFTYTLATNPGDPSLDGMWTQSYSYYTKLFDPFDSSQVDHVFEVQTIAGTGNALVTYTSGAPDLSGWTPTGLDSTGTQGLHMVATFMPGSNGGDIAGEFDAFVPEPSAWGGLFLAGIGIALRRRRLRA